MNKKGIYIIYKLFWVFFTRRKKESRTVTVIKNTSYFQLIKFRVYEDSVYVLFSITVQLILESFRVIHQVYKVKLEWFSWKFCNVFQSN